MILSHWFGSPTVDGSDMAWGCRAIFNRSMTYPLDILWDRQGYQPGKHDAASYRSFVQLLNVRVLPELHRLAKFFYPDSREWFCRHFHVPEYPHHVIVARGSPNGSHGYFYISVSLCRLGTPVPPEIRPDIQKTEPYFQGDLLAWTNQQLSLAVARKQAKREAAAAQKVFASKITGTHKRTGLPLAVGDSFDVHINQGTRKARVLAVNEPADVALAEYIMPSGKTGMMEVDAATHAIRKRVNSKRVPKAWARRM